MTFDTVTRAAPIAAAFRSLSLPVLTLLTCSVTAVNAGEPQPASASAQTSPRGTYMVYGAGTQSCGKWTAEEKTPLLHDYMNSWVLGYVTALGGVAGARNTDSAAITARVDNYCHANPLKGVHEAAAALVVELAKTK